MNEKIEWSISIKPTARNFRSNAPISNPPFILSPNEFHSFHQQWHFLTFNHICLCTWKSDPIQYTGNIKSLFCYFCHIWLRIEKWKIKMKKKLLKKHFWNFAFWLEKWKVWMNENFYTKVDKNILENMFGVRHERFLHII